MKASAIGLILLWGSCLVSGLQGAEAATPNEPCEWTMHLPERLVEPEVVVFGEMHGTKEAPYVFLSAVCAALAASPEGEVVAALEYPIVEAENLQTYLDSDGSDVAQRQLMASGFWQRETQDGRTSLAMFRLIDALRQLRAADDRITVVPFVPQAGSGEHEQRMAEILERSIRERESAQHFVLVGNLHARKTIGRSSDPEFRSMVRRMAKEPMSVVIAAARGDYWACTMKGCGRKSRGDKDQGQFGSLPMLQPVLRPHRHYDWTIIMDRYTASPPANHQVPERRGG